MEMCIILVYPLLITTLIYMYKLYYIASYYICLANVPINAAAMCTCVV